MTFEYIGAGQQSMGLQYPIKKSPQQNGAQTNFATNTPEIKTDNLPLGGNNTTKTSTGPWKALLAIIANNEYSNMNI